MACSSGEPKNEAGGTRLKNPEIGQKGMYTLYQKNHFLHPIPKSDGEGNDNDNLVRCVFHNQYGRPERPN